MHTDIEAELICLLNTVLNTAKDSQARMDVIGSRIDNVGSRVDKIGNAVTRLDEHVKQVDDRLERVEAKVDNFSNTVFGPGDDTYSTRLHTVELDQRNMLIRENDIRNRTLDKEKLQSQGWISAKVALISAFVGGCVTLITRLWT